MQKIVVAVDSFKGSLTAHEVSNAVCETLRSEIPECEVVSVPLSDGGEGTADILVDAMGGIYHKVEAFDALMRPITVQLGVVDGVAIVEMAKVAGLAMLTMEERNPMKTTTYGVGVMLQAALDLGYKKIIIGIGGSATNDAGLGAMQALGLRCYNSQGRAMKNPITGADLSSVAHFDLSALKNRLQDVELTVACDVQNPFCGAKGAARIFAPQKGASPEEVAILDAGLRRVSNIWRKSCGVSVDNLPGAGAAGGLGGAFAALLGAKIYSGIECVLNLVEFDNKVKDADLIITGEGSIDAQSLMGKVLSGILARSKKSRIPVMAIGGRIFDKDALLKAGLVNCIEVSPRSIPIEEAVLPDVAIANIKAAIRNWVHPN